MKNIIFFLLIPFFSFSQTEINIKIWVGFTDKGSVTTKSYSAKDLFSERAIARRDKHDIDLHFTDLPLNKNYIDSLKAFGLEILNTSKWFNGVTAQTTNSSIIEQLKSIDFISSIDTLSISLQDIQSRTSSKFDDIVVQESSYGEAKNQIEMIGGHTLHQQGYQGQNVHIAVFDAGFKNVNKIDAFSHLFDYSQILGTWDYVDRESNVYDDNNHGMLVLSIMAAQLENNFLGTAPKASYWLLRTEDAGSETLIEEYNWAIAAEFADSVGVDIINSSLGYTTFDISSQNHSYEDLDGRTTIVTRAAVLASRKGIIVCNSAGNSGNSTWKYIGAPADADSILTVGSVDENQIISSFSSYGPTYDGRIKPTLCAQGRNTAIVTNSNSISTSNGTSFSSPIIAGMTACLWQAHYNKKNIQIIEALKNSSHLYQFPDDQLGNGIPNYGKANAILLGIKDIENPTIEVYPNPAYSEALIYFYTAQHEGLNFKIFDFQSQLVDQGQLHWSYSNVAVRLPKLSSGIYIIQLNTQHSTFYSQLSIVN